MSEKLRLKLKTITCLHRRTELYGPTYYLDQSSNLYRKSRCKDCGKDTGSEYSHDDGSACFFM